MTWRRVRLPFTFVAVLALGCTGEFRFDTPGGGGIVTPDGGGGGTAARQFFDLHIDPMLSLFRPSGGPCAGLCHREGTPYAPQGAPVLFGNGQTPDIIYNSLLSSGFVGTTPAESAFLNVVHQLENLGDSFCGGPGNPYAECTQDEVSRIAEWIELENQ